MTKYEEIFYRNVERITEDINVVAKELEKSNYINLINMNINLYEKKTDYKGTTYVTC